MKILLLCLGETSTMCLYYFLLTNELEMTINGKYHPLSNHIAIINQGDLYQINKGRNLIELKIPMAYFYLEDSAF